MIARWLRRLKRFAGDPRWLIFFIQRQFRHPVVRDWIAKRVAGFQPKPPGDSVHVEVDAHLLSLRETGIALLGHLLSPERCEELRRYFRGRQVHDPYRPDSSSFLPDEKNRHKSIHVAHHFAHDVLKAPYLLSVANNPYILGIVARYLRCKPTIGYLAVWWSYPTNKSAREAELFHRDIDNWKFVKLFVYLTDVGHESGPHCYVKFSASSAKLTCTRRFNDDEIYKAFGPENIVTMTAAAGEGFLEDTFGVHRGKPLEAGMRLMFQVVYSISPLPYGPLRPICSVSEVPFQNLDPWINRVYVG